VADVACLAATLLVYVGALRIRARTSSPVFNPTLLSILFLGAALGLTHTGYERYRDATQPISLLLGPAVVALAVPLHEERETLLRHGRALLVGALAGAGAAMLLGWGAAHLLGAERTFSLALQTRTATSPISIAIADELHGSKALSAVMSIIGGIFGATFAPPLLTRLGVVRPIARGVAMGVSAHGIGTARMLQEGRLEAASSSVGMGLGGLIVALVIPGLW
jgi:putative effector of murein hydrolase